VRPLFGARTVVEAAFLVAVPVIALAAGLGWVAIVGAGAGAYLVVLAVEGAIWHDGRKAPAAATPTGAPEPSIGPDDHVRVIRAEPEPPDPQPEPEPVRLVPVPVPPPAPPPQPPEPKPAATVIPITAAGGPRQWNVWDLERIAREHAGGDPIADEERTFLLLYLRDFAGPDGLLPVDFDELVRQSFGSLVASP
jgi:hypothetical protein